MTPEHYVAAAVLGAIAVILVIALGPALARRARKAMQERRDARGK